MKYSDLHSLRKHRWVVGTLDCHMSQPICEDGNWVIHSSLKVFSVDVIKSKFLVLYKLAIYYIEFSTFILTSSQVRWKSFIVIFLSISGGRNDPSGAEMKLLPSGSRNIKVNGKVSPRPSATSRSINDKNFCFVWVLFDSKTREQISPQLLPRWHEEKWSGAVKQRRR